jgi:hypothetical protein
MKNSLDVSNEELAEQFAKRTESDKLKDALIHMIFVGQKRHSYDPETCAGCKDARELSGL